VNSNVETFLHVWFATGAGCATVSVTLYASDMLSIRDSLVEIDARDDAVSNYRAYIVGRCQREARFMTVSDLSVLRKRRRRRRRL